jgi:hypothetical protein
VIVEFYFVRVDPVQEIAAEPATLDLLRDILRPKDHEPRADPELLAVAQLTGWPLVYDDAIPLGYVHCRPTPGAPAPCSVEEIEEHMRTLMTPGEPEEQP